MSTVCTSGYPERTRAMEASPDGCHLEKALGIRCTIFRRNSLIVCVPRAPLKDALGMQKETPGTKPGSSRLSSRLELRKEPLGKTPHSIAMHREVSCNLQLTQLATCKL